MKAVLISIQPKWCELIASGKKTVEVRKSKPKLETPFKVYIYCTKGDPLLKTVDNACFVDNSYIEGQNLYGLYELVNGKVIGEFVCDCIDYVRNYGDCVDSYDCIASCLSANEIIEYAKDKDGNFVYTYAWHISDLVIFDEPRELWEFHYASVLHTNCFGKHTKRVTRPPQSWCYVEVEG